MENFSVTRNAMVLLAHCDVRNGAGGGMEAVGARASLVERLVYSIGSKKHSDRDGDDVTDSLLRRRLTEIEEHWLERCRPESLNKLGCRNLAVLDCEDTLPDLALEIIREHGDAAGGTGFVKRPADIWHSLCDGDNGSRGGRLVRAADEPQKIDAEAGQRSFNVNVIGVNFEQRFGLRLTFFAADCLEQLLLILEIDIECSFRHGSTAGDVIHACCVETLLKEGCTGALNDLPPFDIILGDLRRRFFLNPGTHLVFSPVVFFPILKRGQSLATAHQFSLTERFGHLDSSFHYQYLMNEPFGQ